MPLPKTRSTVELNPLMHSYLIYGDAKVGKTTLVSKFGDDGKNKVLFFPTEPGHKFLSVYQWKTADGKMPSSWGDFLLCLKEFGESDEFSCLAVDTASHLVRWCVQYILDKRDADDESEGNYGDIFRRITREFNRVINKLGMMGKGIIFIAHVAPKKNKDDQTYPDLPDKYENLFHGMVDYIFYCYADAEGKRHIRTKGTYQVVAGDRSGKLPAIMPMDAKALIEALSKNELPLPGITADVKPPVKNYAPGAENRT